MRLKPIAPGYVLLFGIAAVVTLIWSGIVIRDLRFTNTSKDNYINSLQDSVKLYKTRSGNSAGTITTVKLDDETFRKVYAKELNRINKELGIKIKDLESLLTAKIESIGKGSGTVVYNEASKSYTVSDTTKWFSINGKVDSLGWTYNYRHYDSLTLVEHRKRRWFKPDQYLFTVTAANPNTQILDISNSTITTKPKRFHLGPQVTFDGKIRVGLGLTYSLISF